MTTNHYLYLKIPNLPALLTRRRIPSTTGRPLVVVSDMGERGVVRAASAEAQAMGVREGDLVRQVRRLGSRIDLVPEQPEERMSIVRELTAMLKSYTPVVHSRGEDRFLLDLSGTERLWGEPETVARELLDRLTHEWQLAAAIGIGTTETVARVAATTVEAPGMRSVQPEQVEAFFDPLPVEMLPKVGPKTRAQLERYGMATIGQLAEVSQELLVETFGGYRGMLLWRLARGKDTGRLKVNREVSSLQREMPMPEDTLNRSAMQAHLSFLSGRLSLDLQRRKMSARKITLRIQYSDGLVQQMNKSLDSGTQLEVELAAAARSLLDELLSMRRIRVSQLGLSVGRLRPASETKPLFDLRGLQRHEAVAEKVFHVRNRYGFNSMVFGRACAG